MLTQSTRLKCKADTCYVPTADGVYLCGNESRLTLKGKSLYPLLVHLIPHLTGDITLAELTGELDGDKKRMVTNLLEKLVDHRFLIDMSQSQPHTLDQRALEAYAPNITFIESFQPSAPAHFERFREQRLLLIGATPACMALIQASWRSGASKLNVLITPGDGEEAEARQEVREALSRCASPEARLSTLDREDEAEVRAAIEGCDSVLHLAQWPLVERAQLVNRLCVELRKTLLQAVLIDNQAWIGPLVCPENDGCWECAWRRLQATLPQLTERASGVPTVFTPARAALLANRLLFPVFQYATRSGSLETAGKISVVDLATSLSEVHVFLPHPSCQTCQHAVVPDATRFLEQIQQLSQQNPVDPDGFLEDLVPCVDERAGLLTALEAGSFAQAPLAVYQARLANPTEQTLLPAEREVVAVSVYARDASMRAAQKACERYAARYMDQRRLLSPEAAHQAAVPMIAPGQLLSGARTTEKEGNWTWGLDLQTRQAVLLPAARVFSADQQGVSSGMIWDEAVCQALLDWCAALTVAQIQEARVPYPWLNLEGILMTPDCAHLYRLLRATGEPFTLYDVTGDLEVPTFATCLREKVVAYSSHLNVMQVLRQGFEQALQQYQSELFQQPAYAPSAVPDLPERLRGAHWKSGRYARPDAWPARLEWLLQRLQARGLRAFVAPLNHEPALARVLPFSVRVLVGSSKLEKGA